jgi:hypothetical protein
MQPPDQPTPISGDSTAVHGAYGFQIAGALRTELLLPVPAAWPLLRLEQHHSSCEHGVLLPGGVRLALDEASRTATFYTEQPIPSNELIHPLLASAAVGAARWVGRDAYHAGAFLPPGGAWLLLAEGGAGKSTTLGMLATLGIGILTDDVLVLDGRHAFAGPRTIDLRPDAAAWLKGTDALAPSRQNTRYRLELAHCVATAPICGVVFLEWGARVDAEPSAAASERLTRIAAQRFPGGVDTAASALDLASLPCWVLRRPQGFESAREACHLLLEIAS